MRAILIDPTARSVEEIDTIGDSITLRTLIRCQYLTVVRIAAGEDVIVDDEGMLADKPGPFFTIGAYPSPLAGRGVILGHDARGNSTASALPLATVAAAVTLPDIELDHLHEEIGETERFGRIAPVYLIIPVFRPKKSEPP